MERNRSVFMTQETTQVDVTTGQIIQQTLVTSKHIGTEPEYIKLYTDDILYLANMSHGLSPMLYALIKRMTYEGHIILNAFVKKSICAEINRSMFSLDKSLTNFVKEGILKRIDKSVYLANPYLFARGRWSDIKKIRMTIEWNKEGRFVEKPVIITDSDVD